VTAGGDGLPVSDAAACAAVLTPEKRAAVKGYIATLGPELRRKYGSSRHYSPGQVRDTVAERKLDIDYLCWAYLLYCSPIEFRSLHEAAGETCDPSAMHEVVAEGFFGGNAAFEIGEVVDTLASGAGDALAAGTGAAGGWLADVDWTSLLDLT
jgi:hypothetical protein